MTRLEKLKEILELTNGADCYLFFRGTNEYCPLIGEMKPHNIFRGYTVTTKDKIGSWFTAREALFLRVEGKFNGTYFYSHDTSNNMAMTWFQIS